MDNELIYSVPVSILGEMFQARFWCRFGRDKDRALVIVYQFGPMQRYPDRAELHIYPVDTLSTSKHSQLPAMPHWAKPVK